MGIRYLRCKRNTNLLSSQFWAGSKDLEVGASIPTEDDTMAWDSKTFPKDEAPIIVSGSITIKNLQLDADLPVEVIEGILMMVLEKLGGTKEIIIDGVDVTL